MKISVVLVAVLIGSISLQSCKKAFEPEYLYTNQQFMDKAASGNMLEIMTAELVASRSVEDTVKKYAYHMFQSHTLTLDELEVLAARKSLKIPDSLIQTDQTNYNLVVGFTSDKFDHNYIGFTLFSHETNFSFLYRAAQPNGVPDEELRWWAASKLAEIQAHFSDAENVSRLLKDQQAAFAPAN